MFLSLDGVDGVGKSTQLKLLADWLIERGVAVVTCRDPGSTPLGEAIREILLRGDSVPIHRRSEMLLYMAARSQLVEEIIRPSLAAGKTVLADRYLLANLVYQGYAGGLDLEQLRRVGEVAIGGVSPHRTILLDMPAEAASERLQRSLDRIEAQGIDYLRRVREGYLVEARRRPREIVIIDAARDVPTVQADVRRVAAEALAAHPPAARLETGTWRPEH